jgi:hypothetical protein
MKKSELKKLSTKILNLEQKCRNGEDISKNMKAIEEIADNLSLEDLLELDFLLEKNLQS